MIDLLKRFFCNHEFKKLKDDSYLCEICNKTKPKITANIRKTNSYHSNMVFIKRQIKIEKERLKNK